MKTKRDDYNVTQANALVEACQRLSLNEKRFLLLGISLLNPMQGGTEVRRFIITTDDWLKYFPDDPNPWRSLRVAQKKLMTRYVTFRTGPDKGEDMSWFDVAKYCEGNAAIEIKFAAEINTYLLGQIKFFTNISIRELTSLHTLHSIRLYELLKQYKHTGQLKVTADDFRYSMNCKYPRVQDLRIRVIEPALKEIRRETGLEVTFRQVKRGRKITHLVFEFTPDTRKQKQASHDAPIENTDPDNPTLPTTRKTKKTRDMTTEEIFSTAWAAGQ